MLYLDFEMAAFVRILQVDIEMSELRKNFDEVVFQCGILWFLSQITFDHLSLSNRTGLSKN
jgi:hypothetical protein